jgi:non-specific serine/threonine protein kinase
MTPEQWQRINNLFESARELPENERDEFVARNCAADKAVESEVRSLLEWANRPKQVSSVLQNVLATQSHNDLTRGSRISRYVVSAEIGRGGMGEVFRATDPVMRRNVAIKVVSGKYATEEGGLERFQREVRAVAALNHPNICTVYDAGEYDGRPFLVMELLEGESLRERLDRGLMTAEDIVDIGAQIADGLEYAHSKGVIHRDVKPPNIFITSSGHAKVLDFGIAKLLAGETMTLTATSASIPDPVDPTMTQAGMTVGTIAYMSPEQARGEPADRRSDVFSLGVTLYEAATGTLPHAGTSPYDVLYAILHRSPTPPRQLRAEIPAHLEHIILKSLRKQLPERYQSAKQFASDLRAITKSHTVAPSVKAVAVLPFTNVGGNPDADYLGEGIAESILNNLSQLRGLRVVPRTLAFQFKGRETDLAAITEQLGVSCVLTGRIVFRDAMLQIQAELIDTVAASQLWGDRFRGKFETVFDAEEQISKKICAALRIQLSAEESDNIGRLPTKNPQAYQQYLRGLAYWNQGTADSLEPALRSFLTAVTADPEYAPAYAGLALAYAWLAHWRLGQPNELYTQAKFAVEKALNLGEHLAETHVAAGHVRLYLEHDWAAAQRHSLRALELNRDLARVQGLAGDISATQGDFNHAIACFRREQELDPLSHLPYIGQAMTMLFARRYAEGVEFCHHTLRHQPTNIVVSLLLIELLALNGDHTEALAAAERFAMLGEQFGDRRFEPLAQVAASAGRQEQAYELLACVVPGSYRSVTVLAALGELDRAFAALDQCYVEREWQLAYLHLDPRLDALRADFRFADLVSKIGIARHRGSANPQLMPRR